MPISQLRKLSSNKNWKLVQDYKASKQENYDLKFSLPTQNVMVFLGFATFITLQYLDGIHIKQI